MEENDHRNYFMINLHGSLDWTGSNLQSDSLQAALWGAVFFLLSYSESFACWVIFLPILSSAEFFKTNCFKKFFLGHYQSVKQFGCSDGSDLGPDFTNIIRGQKSCHWQGKSKPLIYQHFCPENVIYSLSGWVVQGSKKFFGLTHPVGQVV